jgi:hypothetical protein
VLDLGGVRFLIAQSRLVSRSSVGLGAAFASRAAELTPRSQGLVNPFQASDPGRTTPLAPVVLAYPSSAPRVRPISVRGCPAKRANDC